MNRKKSGQIHSSESLFLNIFASSMLTIVLVKILLLFVILQLFYTPRTDSLGRKYFTVINSSITTKKLFVPQRFNLHRKYSSEE